MGPVLFSWQMRGAGTQSCNSGDLGQCPLPVIKARRAQLQSQPLLSMDYSLLPSLFSAQCFGGWLWDAPLLVFFYFLGNQVVQNRSSIQLKEGREGFRAL